MTLVHRISSGCSVNKLRLLHRKLNVSNLYSKKGIVKTPTQLQPNLTKLLVGFDVKMTLHHHHIAAVYRTILPQCTEEL